MRAHGRLLATSDCSKLVEFAPLLPSNSSRKRRAVDATTTTYLRYVCRACPPAALDERMNRRQRLRPSKIFARNVCLGYVNLRNACRFSYSQIAFVDANGWLATIFVLYLIKHDVNELFSSLVHYFIAMCASFLLQVRQLSVNLPTFSLPYWLPVRLHGCERLRLDGKFC